MGCEQGGALLGACVQLCDPAPDARHGLVIVPGDGALGLAVPLRELERTGCGLHDQELDRLRALEDPLRQVEHLEHAHVGHAEVEREPRLAARGPHPVVDHRVEMPVDATRSDEHRVDLLRDLVVLAELGAEQTVTRQQECLVGGCQQCRRRGEAEDHEPSSSQRLCYLAASLGPVQKPAQDHAEQHGVKAECQGDHVGSRQDPRNEAVGWCRVRPLEAPEDEQKGRHEQQQSVDER